MLLYFEEAPRAYTLEWRNWQTHGTQKPSQPVRSGKPQQGYTRFPASGTSGNPLSRQIHYKNHYRIVQLDC
jgi:hypothetical protein